jgi:hypothetical protein
VQLVTNLAITQAVEARGFYYAPDPSSQYRRAPIRRMLVENRAGCIA